MDLAPQFASLRSVSTAGSGRGAPSTCAAPRLPLSCADAVRSRCRAGFCGGRCGRLNSILPVDGHRRWTVTQRNTEWVGECLPACLAARDATTRSATSSTRRVAAAAYKAKEQRQRSTSDEDDRLRQISRRAGSKPARALGIPPPSSATPTRTREQRHPAFQERHLSQSLDLEEIRIPSSTNHPK